MPSWNIHTAHVERLLREEGAESLGVRDANAFLLGNLAPDIYVGYMVPDTTYRIDYKLTHQALREHIPLPSYDEFWNFYVARDEALLAQCAAFPPYSILERDARAAADVARRIVEKNRDEHVSGVPVYQLLSSEFFETARQEAHDTIVRGLRSYACHRG